MPAASPAYPRPPWRTPPHAAVSLAALISEGFKQQLSSSAIKPRRFAASRGPGHAGPQPSVLHHSFGCLYTCSSLPVPAALNFVSQLTYWWQHMLQGVDGHVAELPGGCCWCGWVNGPLGLKLRVNQRSRCGGGSGTRCDSSTQGATQHEGQTGEQCRWQVITNISYRAMRPVAASCAKSR
jgi:hypothetical protein